MRSLPHPFPLSDACYEIGAYAKMRSGLIIRAQAILYDFSQPEPGSQAALRTFHFVLLSVNGDQLEGQAIDRHGNIVDRFELMPGK